MIIRKDRQMRRGQPGQMMVIFALTLTVFMGAMMLGVDLSRLRAETENAQRAANAAALAGVVFLPQFQDSAYSRALATAKQNGFVPSTTSGVSITTQIPDGYPNRLKVTVTEPVSLVFGKIFGLGSRTISRSSTAEFAEPLEMGASDYVLGYAPFPTSIVTPTAGATPTQGFYLIARGPYGQQENGDAYSQYFESHSGKILHNGSTAADPCPTDPTICNALNTNENLTLNPDRAKVNFTGYDFVVDNPFNNPLVLKIFDPYDEGPFNQDAAHKPQLQTIADPFKNEFIDQYSCDNGGTQICPSGAPPAPTALNFTLSGPYQTTYDTSPKPVTPMTTTDPIAAQIPMSPTGDEATGYNCVNDCVLSNNSDGSFTAGDDPTHTQCVASGTCGTAVSPYAYKFLNYAIIRHKGLYRIHVTTTLSGNSKYGTGGNVFGLAACADLVPVLGSPSSPAGVGGNVAVSDPASPTAPNMAWNPASCPNPNNLALSGVPAACAHPGTAPADSCVHIYAENRMCVINILSAGNDTGVPSLIPLGFVPSSYAGKTLQVKLYDVGDINGPSNNSVQVLTPAGDLTHNSLSGSTEMNTPPSITTAFSSTLNYTWSAAPTDPGSNYRSYTPPPLTNNYDQPIGNLSLSSGNYNGSWVTINIPIPANNTSTNPAGNGYDAMVNAFGGYWKMLYYVGPGSFGNDTTTWEISVAGSPTHLVQ